MLLFVCFSHKAEWDSGLGCCICMHVCIYACMYICMHACMHGRMHLCLHEQEWRSEGNLGKLVLSFYHVSFRDRIQVVKLGSKRCYPLSTPPTGLDCYLFVKLITECFLSISREEETWKQLPNPCSLCLRSPSPYSLFWNSPSLASWVDHCWRNKKPHGPGEAGKSWFR